jgi:hypothetical protein
MTIITTALTTITATVYTTILQCEGTGVWRDGWLERKFTSVHNEIRIKKNSIK